MHGDTCLPDQTSIHEDLADTTPLTHDDLGCPIRRDRLYHQDNTGATAKPLSGPPVSPSLFRSPRSSAPERPSPKAIQASIKESATLAAAISMQWKEEVTAMRRELAELRRDLCKELRAFNSNFNTFTQHYNTWSPQGFNMADGAAEGLGEAAGTGTGTGTRAGTGPGHGTGTTTAAGRGTGTEREKKARVSKVSVGTQARSKVLVRQSTADAAVNCPEEKDSARRSLPKQLSMDPSILACPQSMYVESAIPLSLDPILPGSVRAIPPDTFALTAVPFTDKLDPDPQLPDKAVVSHSDTITNEPVTTQDAESLSSETVSESPRDALTAKQEMPTTLELTDTGKAHMSHSQSEQSHSNIESVDSEQNVRDRIQLPYPVPIVTVSPPKDSEYDIISDPESPECEGVDKTQPVSQDVTPASLLFSLLEDSDPSDSTEREPEASNMPIVLSSNPVSQDSPSVCDVLSFDLETVLPCNVPRDNRCPSIVVSEYLDADLPTSPTDSDKSPDPIIIHSDDPSDPPQEQTASVSSFASSLGETQVNPDPDSQESEWPPLPEPLDTTPIYHADLVHFDLVMLTSLDQDDLDSVFMDPEPEPFDLSADSSFNAEDFDPPIYHFDYQSSPQSTVDPDTTAFKDSSAEFIFLDPAMEYHLAHMSHDAASGFHEIPCPQVTVTISPPSSLSPDTSLEIDVGPMSPAPDSPQSYTNPSLQELHQEPMEPDDVMGETLEHVAASQETESLIEELDEATSSSPERSSSEYTFLWYRWQKRGQRQDSVQRSASVELWSGRYEFNSSEITYVSLTL